MREETEQKWEESWGVGQVGPRLSFRKSPPPSTNVKDGCCRFGPRVEQRFILDEKLQIATKEENSWSRGCAASSTSGHRRVAPDVLELLNESD